MTSSLVPRPSAIISVGGKDGLVITQLFVPKVGERNLTHQYIIRITFKGDSVKAHSYSLFCVGLPDITLKHEQLAAALLLYEWEDVYFWLQRDCLGFPLATRCCIFSTLNVVVSREV